MSGPLTTPALPRIVGRLDEEQRWWAARGEEEGEEGVMWAKLAQLVVYAMDVFWSHWGTSGVCVCVYVYRWGLAQIYTFIPSLSLSPSSVNTLGSNVSGSHSVPFSVIFRISVRFHVGFDLFPAFFRLAASQDGRLPGQLHTFSHFVLVLWIARKAASTLASNRC